MHTLIQPLFVIVLYVFIRAGDIAIGAIIARDTLRVVVYGLVAILALIALIVSLI